LAIELPLMLKDRWQITVGVEHKLLKATDGCEITPPFEFIRQGLGDLHLLHFQRILEANSAGILITVLIVHQDVSA
jgi:hypothetical protein